MRDIEANDMFQMNCLNCRALIKSPLLSEVQVIECPQCKEIVRAQNVVVSTKKFSTGLRSSLKNLLLAARDKFRLNKSHVLDAQTSYDIDKRIAKLLRRDDFRLDMSYDLYVQIDFDNNKRLARLLNISSIGASIEFAGRGQLPENTSGKDLLLPEANSEINLQLPMTGDAGSLSLLSRVIWSRLPTKDTIFPSVTMGVQFKEIDEETRACLWDFIVNAETSGHT
jgi:hypothetical protein